MDYVILILILLIVVVLFLGLIVLSACTADEKIEMWIEMREEIDNSDLARKKRDANFVWTDEKTNKLD